MKKKLAPHITEKTYRLVGEKADQATSYTFKVPRVMRKEQIKRVIEKEHKVTVTSVKVVNIPEKTRVFKRLPGTVSGFKKAIVRVKKGDRITAFDQAIAPKNEEKK